MVREQKQYDGAETVFSTDGAGTPGQPHAENELDADSHSSQKLTHMFTDLNVRHETINTQKITQEKTYMTLGTVMTF